MLNIADVIMDAQHVVNAISRLLSEVNANHLDEARLKTALDHAQSVVAFLKPAAPNTTAPVDEHRG